MRYTVETVGGDELELHQTLTEATRAAVSRLEDDPELGTLHVYSFGRMSPMGTHEKTVTHGIPRTEGGDLMPQTFKTYTIRVMGPDPREDETARAFDRERGDVSEILRGHALRHIEYTINDMLPDGWYAKVEDTL